MSVPGRSSPPRSATDKIAAAPALAIERLTLSNFRNHDSLRLAPAGRSLVLAGPNGIGKTNILEAVSWLTPGRGMRNARLADVARHDSGASWAVAADLRTPDGDCRLGTGLDPDYAANGGAESGASARRLVHINGAAARGPVALGEYLRLIWLTPSMDRLFTDSASARRRFFDRLVLNFESSHAASASAYERAMRERNIVLERDRADSAWLDALEGAMAEHGIALAAARRDVAARLRGALGEPDGDWPRLRLRLEGLLEHWLDEASAVDVEDRYRERLKELRPLDAAAGRATEGAHRTDLAVFHADKNMPAANCSTGEQKALLIAIILANVRLQAASFGAPPVLLLDEIAAHLDRARRARLFEQLAALNAQAWITGTDEALFEDFRPFGRIYVGGENGFEERPGRTPAPAQRKQDEV